MYSCSLLAMASLVSRNISSAFLGCTGGCTIIVTEPLYTMYSLPFGISLPVPIRVTGTTGTFDFAAILKAPCNILGDTKKTVQLCVCETVCAKQSTRMYHKILMNFGSTMIGVGSMHDQWRRSKLYAMDVLLLKQGLAFLNAAILPSVVRVPSGKKSTLQPRPSSLPHSFRQFSWLRLSILFNLTCPAMQPTFL